MIASCAVMILLIAYWRKRKLTNMKYTHFILLLFLKMTEGLSWTQQYGDPSSTSFVHGLQVSTPSKATWNYSVPNDYDYYKVSFFYNSPAFSPAGVVFLPLAYSRPYPDLLFLEIRAVSHNGTELWVSEDIHGHSTDCAGVLMTNVLYSEEHHMVIAGWNCADSFPYYAKEGNLVGLNASNGSLLWRSENLKLNDAATISMSKDTVFVSGGFSCYLDGQILVTEQKNKSLLVGIDIVTGIYTCISYCIINSFSLKVNSFGVRFKIMPAAVPLKQKPLLL